MERDTLWENFVHTGRIEDYLRYRAIEDTQGQQIAPLEITAEGSVQHAADGTWHRHTGERP